MGLGRVYVTSMYGLPLCGTSGGLGGWGVRQIIFGSFLVLHWSAMSLVFFQSGIGKFAKWQLRMMSGFCNHSIITFS